MAGAGVSVGALSFRRSRIRATPRAATGLSGAPT